MSTEQILSQQEQSNLKRNERQAEAAHAWATEAEYKGTLYCGTGWGKTKCAVVDCIARLGDWFSEGITALIVVAKETDRDETWPAEIAKFQPEFKPRIICWASLPKEDLSNVEYLILDEIHHLTSRNIDKLRGYQGTVLGLTATPPTDEETLEYINEIAPPCYQFALEKSVQETIVAPYKISLVMIEPDNKQKTLDGGTKKKPFKVTEYGQLQYLDTVIQQTYIKLKNWQHPYLRRLVSKRVLTVYNSPTKRRAAKHILQTVYSAEKRILVFCGGEDQLEQLLPNFSYHSGNKKTVGKERYKAFMEERCNLLGTIRMLDESANVPNLDIGIIIQASSSKLQGIQRIGRIIRYRPGHEGKIYLLCLAGTQDQNWVTTSLSSLPDYRVERHIYNSVEDFINDKSLKWLL